MYGNKLPSGHGQRVKCVNKLRWKAQRQINNAKTSDKLKGQKEAYSLPPSIVRIFKNFTCFP